MHDEWQPANDVESAMASALKRGDTQRYAGLLTTTRWYLPVVDGASGWRTLSARLGLAGDHVVAYTSTATLSWALGELADGYEETGFAAMESSWPGPDHRLAVNPGTPIAVFLRIDGVASMAAGRGAFVPGGEINDAVSRYALDAVRRICLSVLDSGTAERDQAPGGPVDELEARLLPAVEARDSTAFLRTLLEGEVVVLAGEPPAEQTEDAGFPWLTISGPLLTAIPVFSSLAMLARTTRGDLWPVPMSFVEVVANWPDTEFLLCFNLGTSTELIMPGAVMPELARAILAAARDTSETAD